MKTIQLISTSNEDKLYKENVIYLGNWCIEDKYIIDDSRVIEYPWDNRKKLDRDNEYINKLYENILNDLSVILDEFHKEKNSKSYWRILIGYWLFYYLSTNYERWINIDNALLNNTEINFYQSLDIENFPVPYNTREFINLTSDKKWNHLKYTKIIEFYTKRKKLKIKLESKKYNNEAFYFNYTDNYIHKIKIFLINLYLNIFKKKIKNNKIVLFKTYLGLKNEINLNLKFKQFPFFLINKTLKRNPDFDLRKSLSLKYKPQNLFEEYIVKDFFNTIPKEFLENYKEIEKHIINSNLPSNPSLIMTTRSLATDNIFIRYTAMQKEKGCKFIYAQHGGAYGQIKFSWAEDHEISISDLYLTWGWKKKNNLKVLPFLMIKDLNKIKFDKKNKIKNICYFVRSRQKYTGRIDSSTGSNQMSKYFNHSLLFAKELNNYKIFDIIPRLHEAEFEWNHSNIWKKNKFKNISYTNTENLKYVYKNYDFIIYSYIGTGFLESLSLNKPFILISSLDEWPLRSEALEDFKKLEEAKIFFTDTVKAKNHLNFIHNNLSNWWDNEETVKVKNFFKEKYARLDTDKKRIEKFYDLINKVNKNVY